MCTLMYEPLIAFSCDDISPKTKVARLEELLKTIEKFDVNITLFVVPKNRADWNSCGSLIEVLKDAQTCGHEIGLHGLRHIPFETANPLSSFGVGYSSIKDKILKGLRILNEKLETNPKGFRAPYHHGSKSLLRVLNDLNFLYDSSKIDFTSVLFSYAPPLRTIWVSRKQRPISSRIFHPINLKLWEIPVSMEFTWYNLKFEVNSFHSFLKRNISKVDAGCIVINSHIGALSTWGLQILKQFFLCIKDTGLSKLTLQKMAERHTSLETAKAYYV